MTRTALAVAAACAVALAACGSCSKGDSATSSAASSSSSMVPEVLPRCRGESQRLAIPGEDVIVGDVAVAPRGLLVGVIRGDGSKRVASVIRASLDLATSSIVDVGPPAGDEPPPSPRWNGDTAYVSFITRRPADGGPKLRELRVARLEDASLGKVEANIVQQADESTAFDVAWNEGGAALVAWDEDAPPRADAAPPRETYAPEGRGFVKVQILGSDTRRVASPETSDAESPRLLPRPGGGFWLAWLARRAEDDGYEIESPGEKRVFRWVEVVSLSATGEPAGPVRRVTPEKGRALSFELGRSGSDLVVLVQDEAAPSEGAGARIVRYVVAERIESTDIVDAGVGATVAELVPVTPPAVGLRWLAWSDTSEHAHVTPLGGGLGAVGRPTLEPSFDGARVLAAVGAESIFALVGAAPAEPAAAAPRGRPEIRRFTCTQPDASDKGK
ncbi:MAG TPA: hypothetical protein VM925_32345 [Labilithrix sp.]|nr:hypothetical protein [Labilithrix sp.]